MGCSFCASTVPDLTAMPVKKSSTMMVVMMMIFARLLCILKTPLHSWDALPNIILSAAVEDSGPEEQNRGRGNNIIPVII